MLVWLGSKDFNNYCSYAHLTLQEQAEAERRRGGFWCLYSWAVQRAIEENPHVESFIRSGRSALAMFSWFHRLSMWVLATCLRPCRCSFSDLAIVYGSQARGVLSSVLPSVV